MPLPTFFMQHDGQIFTLRGLLKIVLGGVSAITVFPLRLLRQAVLRAKKPRSRKMASLYSSAKEQFERGSINSEQLFSELAREEIIENGSWFHIAAKTRRLSIFDGFQTSSRLRRQSFPLQLGHFFGGDAAASPILSSNVGCGRTSQLFNGHPR